MTLTYEERHTLKHLIDKRTREMPGFNRLMARGPRHRTSIKPIIHGTVSGYSRGCREQCCSEAMSAYNKERKRLVKERENDLT